MGFKLLFSCVRYVCVPALLAFSSLANASPALSVEIIRTNQSKLGPELNLVVHNKTGRAQYFSMMVQKEVVGKECDASPSRKAPDYDLTMAEKNSYSYAATVAPLGASASYLALDAEGGDTVLPCTISYQLSDKKGLVILKGKERIDSGAARQVGKSSIGCECLPQRMPSIPM